MGEKHGSNEVPGKGPQDGSGGSFHTDEQSSGELSHVDAEGRARMVDVGVKSPVRRTAAASGRIRLSPETVSLIRENGMKKGDVLTVAQIAGIQAAKKTHELIPLCHPLPITRIEVTLELDDEGVEVRATVGCTGRTGVEMEALTAVNVALLSVYDMCKAVDSAMVMEDIHLVEKRKEEES